MERIARIAGIGHHPHEPAGPHRRGHGPPGRGRGPGRRRGRPGRRQPGGVRQRHRRPAARPGVHPGPVVPPPGRAAQRRHRQRGQLLCRRGLRPPPGHPGHPGRHRDRAGRRRREDVDRRPGRDPGRHRGRGAAARPDPHARASSRTRRARCSWPSTPRGPSSRWRSGTPPSSSSPPPRSRPGATGPSTPTPSSRPRSPWTRCSASASIVVAPHPADVLVVHRRRRRRGPVDHGTGPGAPTIRSSTIRSGNGDIDYHDRLAETARPAWDDAGVDPADVDVVELHDATSAEELYALESLGFFKPGDAGPATMAGDTTIGGRGVTVNPSGGLVARGHPLGATGHRPGGRAGRPAPGDGRPAAGRRGPIGGGGQYRWHHRDMMQHSSGSTYSRRADR